MKNRPGEKIKLASIDELLGVVNEESAMEIEINKIHAFKNHPFKVLDDEKMQDLIESVKVMYARLLDATLAGGAEDTNGILFVRFPIVKLAAALSRSSVTVKRSLKELEDAGLILRVRRGVGEPNRIYTLLPKKEGCRDE